MIGERMKQARLALGYSAEQVASFLNVSPATIYRYENGDISKLPSKFSQPLAEYLCVTPAYLMGWTDEKPPEFPEDVPKNDDVRVLVRGFNSFSSEELAEVKTMMKIYYKKHAKDFGWEDENK